MNPLRTMRKSFTFAFFDDGEGGRFTVDLYRKVHLACADGRNAHAAQCNSSGFQEAAAQQLTKLPMSGLSRYSPPITVRPSRRQTCMPPR